MPFNIAVTPEFLAESKKLSKKYPSLRKDIETLANELQVNPVSGIALGNDVYKIRLAISSKRRGKSGGARVITCVRILAQTVYLVSIYDKSEQANISIKELKARIKDL